MLGTQRVETNIGGLGLEIGFAIGRALVNQGLYVNHFSDQSDLGNQADNVKGGRLDAAECLDLFVEAYREHAGDDQGRPGFIVVLVYRVVGLAVRLEPDDRLLPGNTRLHTGLCQKRPGNIRANEPGSDCGRNRYPHQQSEIAHRVPPFQPGSRRARASRSSGGARRPINGRPMASSYRA